MSDTYDAIIIGGGPAAATAAIYLSRARMRTAMVESFTIMGQLSITEKIENFPGFKSISGLDLLDNMKKQASDFGAESIYGTVSSIEKSEGAWKVAHDSGINKAQTLIIASGASPRKLGVPGETEFTGKGVSYCATCDAAFFKDKNIYVVGGGNTAVEEALYLTKFGKKVNIVHRRDRLRATKIVQEAAYANDKINFIWNSVVEEIKGKDKVTSIVIKDVNTGQTSTLDGDGIFVFAGWLPNVAFAEKVIEIDGSRGIVVDAEMKTSEEGIFACGDCCRRPLRQVITACGDGAVAAESARLYLEKIKGIAYE